MALTLDTINRWPMPHKVGLLIGVIVCISAAYYFGIYQEQADAVELFNGELERLQKELHEHRTIADDLPKYKEELLRLEARFDLALRKLPNEKNLEVLLKDISKVANEAGIEILSIQPRGETIREFYAEIPVEIKLTGSYVQLAVFFDKVSRLERIVNVSNLNVASPQERGDRVILSVTGVATTFRFVAESERASTSKESAKKPTRRRRRRR